MDLHDRTTGQDPPQDGTEPQQWIGSGQAHCIRRIDIAPEGVTIEGASVMITDAPIRVERLAENLHVVHVGLYVEEVHHDPRVDVRDERFYEALRPPNTRS